MVKKAEEKARKARVACEKWREYFKHNINQYHDMHTFVLGEQWTSEESGEMIKTFRKVPLTANKLGTMSNTLLGEQQQNTPQLQVVPLSNCDEQTAHLRELIVKDIVLSTDANTTYQVAAGQSFIGGFGAYYWATEYAHNKSFDLDIIPHYFKDSTRAYFDVGASLVSKTDGMYAGFITRMTRQKFRELHGKSTEKDIKTNSSIAATKDEVALATQSSGTIDAFSWADEESITVQDHFSRKLVPETLYKLSNQQTYSEEELNEIIEKSREINAQQAEQVQMQQMQIAQQMGAPMQDDVQELQPEEDDPEIMTLWVNGEAVRIEDRREAQRSVITHQQFAGDYLLDESEFPSEDLPVIFVDQNSYYDKSGKQMCRSFFGDAKDTQRYINYLRTQSAYILKVSRYDQYMGSKKNVSSNDTAAKWRDPTAQQGMLTYDESPNGYKPEPMRPPELSQSLLTQYQLAIEDLYTCTGLYPTRMGQQGSEVSGAAIDARTRQGSYSTYTAFNSINRAIASGGVVVNQMIPRVYDSERVISLMTPDEGMKNITVNRESDEYGEQIENDIRKGTFEVRLKPGASFEGQKQQSLDSLKEVLQANPTVFNLVADLYADNLPLANTIELKNRLKTLVPPEILAAGKTGKMPQDNGQKQPSPEEQAAMAANKAKMQELDLKKQGLMLQAEKQQDNMKLEMERLDLERVETAAKLQEQELRYAAETNRTQSDAQMNHADNIVKILTHKI